MEKYYEIEFTALLEKMTLAFKMQCELQAFWKRGSKVAETDKVPFRNCVANFNQQLKICCNLTFNTEKKMFLEKSTKFQIVIYTQKGKKNAGQLMFDVAPFLNERNKSKKYEMSLQNCPDKNAKLSFSLKASIVGEKSFDTISQSSQISVDIHNLPEKDSRAAGNHDSHSNILQNHHMKQNSSPIINMQKNKSSSHQISSHADRKMQKKIQPQSDKVEKGSYSEKNDINSAEGIKQFEIENKKIREQLKNKQKIMKQNEELKRRLKDDDYQSCKEYKKKIEQGKKQIESLNNESKGVKKINEDIKKLQRDILKSKQQIMRIVNEADKYGTQVIQKIQEACGLIQY